MKCALTVAIIITASWQPFTSRFFPKHCFKVMHVHMRLSLSHPPLNIEVWALLCQVSIDQTSKGHLNSLSEDDAVMAA